MSYYTDVRVDWHSEDGSVTADMLLAEARAYLSQFSYYAVDDLMADLTELFDKGSGSLKGMMCSDFTDLFRALSKKYPAVRFDIWGHGEDFADVWARRFLGGKVTVKRGPFDAA
ncbi:MAG: hypothetical protein K2V38_08750 [Gemmataceae bacterium]|nr:hypothetical protein [Gemmataceae bacterium]